MVFTREVYRGDACSLVVRLNLDTIQRLQLEVTARDVADAIRTAPKLRLRIKVDAAAREYKWPPQTLTDAGRAWGRGVGAHRARASWRRTRCRCW
jgi:hypothetical protein